MARIAGVDLPRNKRMVVAMTYIVGIGKTTAKKILNEVGISPDLRSDALTEDQVGKIRKIIDEKYPCRRGRKTRSFAKHKAFNGSRNCKRTSPP